jgi:hypothetical protein
VWAGHSCPALLKLILEVDLRFESSLARMLTEGERLRDKDKAKGVGQECPTHMG